MEIGKVENHEELMACAQAMSSSEPWLTYGRAAEACAAALRDPDSELYVAREGDRLVGFLSLTMRAGVFRGYVRLLFTWPERRSSGVGAELLAFAEARIFREAKNVFLCVSAFNARGRAFYARQGYELVGELPDFLAEGQAELLLRKTIGPLIAKT